MIFFGVRWYSASYSGSANKIKSQDLAFLGARTCAMGEKEVAVFLVIGGGGVEYRGAKQLVTRTPLGDNGSLMVA